MLKDPYIQQARKRDEAEGGNDEFIAGQLSGKSALQVSNCT